MEYQTGCWFGTCSVFPYIFMIPTDFHIFQKGVKAPTSAYVRYKIDIHMMLHIYTG